MSKLFFDHLIVLDTVDKGINSLSKSVDEREELNQIIEEILQHRVLGVTYKHLPLEHHAEFTEKFYATPHDEALVNYLSEKIGKNIEKIIKQEIDDLARELLEIISEKT